MIIVPNENTNTKDTVANPVSFITPLLILIFSECRECTIVDSMCFKEGPICYLVFCGINNWFGAREFCRENHADLAVLRNNYKSLTNIAKRIGKLPNQCTYFWLGITTFSWINKHGKL